VRKIVLNPELAPNLTNLKLESFQEQAGWFQSDFEQCAVQVECPKLECCEINSYTTDNFSWFHHMLETATHLETFLSRDLGASSMRLESNHLTHVHVQRGYMLKSLTIWAPRLQQLFLEGPRGMEHLELLESHPTMARALPANFHLSTVETCLEHVGIGANADDTVRAFMTNPRLRHVKRDASGNVMS
jgi:hypothetical protein